MYIALMFLTCYFKRLFFYSIFNGLPLCRTPSRAPQLFFDGRIRKKAEKRWCDDGTDFEKTSIKSRLCELWRARGDSNA